ncbi:hypothetical protein SAMN04489806_1434 [Paramicrobacterium humi]|uniref:Uncharacterized protein n=1 Tax=Paramicrobacterium humi TaxID=640635 RepID=A0A1H4L7I7_9MICO|nr:hypothetical protein SAMN04489806_1434 [Microbacterium humi]
MLAASLLLGGLTSCAQGLLPEWATSFANSSSGWTLLTAVLVFAARAAWGMSAVLGAGSFVLLTVGYAMVSTMRGFYYDPMFFSVIGVLVGPFVGVAACWLRDRGLRAALGTAALAGIGIGDALYGLTVVASTTSPVYWGAIGVLSLALIAGMLVRRIRGVVPVVIAVLGSAAVAAAYLLAFRALSGAP